MGVLGSEGVVEAYESAVEELKRDKETLPAAAALLELGAVQFHQQDTRWVPLVSQLCLRRGLQATLCGV